jgi:hypothetical protein
MPEERIEGVFLYEQELDHSRRRKDLKERPKL